jgi:hypothetical protein
MKNWWTTMLVFAAIVLVAVPVYGSIQFNISRATSGTGTVVAVASNDPPTSYNTSYSTRNGGAFWTTKVGNPSQPVLEEFPVFCLEIWEYFDYGNVTRDLTTLELAPIDNANRTYETAMGPTAAKMVKQLWAQYYPTLTINHANDTNTNVGAFQIAIWELAYDTATIVNLDAGYFKVDGTSAEKTAAQGMLNWLAANPDAPQANLIALTWDGAQDFVGQIPEPISFSIWALFIGVGIFSFNWQRRRRSR